MIADVDRLGRFEREEARATPVGFARNLALLEAMYEHARALRVWEQGADTLPLKVRLAATVHGCIR